jgi:hypothetical protein
MNIPNLIKTPFVDKDGHLTPTAWGILTQIINQMQKNLSNEGYITPQQDTTTITSRLNNSRSTGALLYNSDTNKLMVCENGTFKTVTTS